MPTLKKIIVYLRPIRYLIRLFFHSPKLLFKKINSDFKKDYNAKKLNKKYHIVWCPGLWKSGTTLIEDILKELPLVQANNSFFRIYDDSNLDHIHGISEEMFRKFPSNKLSFLKTHTHFNDHYINIANKYNSKIIISLRDIRDTAVSRYNHIINDKKNHLNKTLKNLSFKEGFIKCAKFEDDAKYSYEWIQGWQNYSKKNNNCLILWYEEFISDPKNYIKKIIDYLEFDNIDLDKLYLKIDSDKQLLKKRGLKENLSQFEPKTFNKGASGEWKKVLDNETLDEFYSILPDDISKVEFKN